MFLFQQSTEARDMWVKQCSLECTNKKLLDIKEGEELTDKWVQNELRDHEIVFEGKAMVLRDTKEPPSEDYCSVQGRGPEPP